MVLFRSARKNMTNSVLLGLIGSPSNEQTHCNILGNYSNDVLLTNVIHVVTYLKCFQVGC